MCSEVPLPSSLVVDRGDRKEAGYAELDSANTPVGAARAGHRRPVPAQAGRADSARPALVQQCVYIIIVLSSACPNSSWTVPTSLATLRFSEGTLTRTTARTCCGKDAFPQRPVSRNNYLPGRETASHGTPFPQPFAPRPRGFSKTFSWTDSGFGPAPEAQTGTCVPDGRHSI
jgi:hypothetical protein